jgi:hypothetical protein
MLKAETNCRGTSLTSGYKAILLIRTFCALIRGQCLAGTLAKQLRTILSLLELTLTASFTPTCAAISVTILVFPPGGG